MSSFNLQRRLCAAAAAAASLDDDAERRRASDLRSDRRDSRISSARSALRFCAALTLAFSRYSPVFAWKQRSQLL